MMTALIILIKLISSYIITFALNTLLYFIDRYFFTFYTNFTDEELRIKMDRYNGAGFISGIVLFLYMIFFI